MRKKHYRRNDSVNVPVCKVRRDHNFETTTNLDIVDCRACLRRMAYERKDVSILTRIYQ